MGAGVVTMLAIPKLFYDNSEQGVQFRTNLYSEYRVAAEAFGSDPMQKRVMLGNREAFRILTAEIIYVLVSTEAKKTREFTEQASKSIDLVQSFKSKSSVEALIGNIESLVGKMDEDSISYDAILSGLNSFDPNKMEPTPLDEEEEAYEDEEYVDYNDLDLDIGEEIGELIDTAEGIKEESKQVEPAGKGNTAKDTSDIALRVNKIREQDRRDVEKQVGELGGVSTVASGALLREFNEAINSEIAMVKTLNPEARREYFKYQEEINRKYGEYDDDYIGQKRAIEDMVMGSWKDIYGPFIDGLEIINGFIVPGGVFISEKTGKKNQGILSLQRGNKYVKNFTFANAIYEDYISACKAVGLNVRNTCSETIGDIQPFKYNPVLQKQIASGEYGDMGAYRAGSSQYLESLRKKIDKIAKVLAVSKVETGSDDEIHIELSPYCMTLAVVNYKPGLGFQLRASCGASYKTEEFARIFVNLLKEREKGSGSLYFNKAVMGDYSISPGKTSVVFTVYLDRESYYSVPDFMGELLVSLEPGMFKPSLSNMIIGRRLDNSIATLDITSKGWCVPIIAGSRSGKGVLTLNILLNVVGTGVPLFYLDGKPDMGALMWKLAEKCGISTPMVVDGSKFEGVTEVDKKPFMAPYADNIRRAVTHPDREPVLCTNITAMVYLKMLMVIRLAFDYHKQQEGSKYGDIFIVADEVYRLSLGVDNLLVSAKEKEKQLKGKENADKLTKVERITKWVTELCGEYSGAGTTSFNEGIRVLSLSQYDAITKYKGTTKNDIVAGFMDTIGLKGAGTARFYGRKQEPKSGAPYALNMTTGSQADAKLVSNYRHFMLSDGGTELEHAAIFKPMLVLNENDSVEYLKSQGVNATQDGPFIGNVIKGIKGMDIAEYRQKYLQNPEIASAIGFEGALTQVARLCGTGDYRVQLSESFNKAFELADGALRYYGIIGTDGIESVYDYITSTRTCHLWTIAEVRDAKLSGRPLGSSEEDGDEEGDGQVAEFSRAGSIGGFTSASEEPKTNNITGAVAGAVAGAAMGAVAGNAIGKGIPPSLRNNSEFEVGEENDFYDPDEILAAKAYRDRAEELEQESKDEGLSDREQSEFIESDKQTWEDVPQEDIDILYSNMMDAMPDGMDELRVISDLLVSDVADGETAPELAEALARRLDLVDRGYIDNYNYSDGVSVIENEEPIDYTVTQTQSTVGAINYNGKDARKILIDTKQTKDYRTLDDRNSIDCRGAGGGRTSIVDKALLGTPMGSQRYIDNLWKSILETAIGNGYKAANITRFGAYGGSMYINGKIAILDGILGGRENIRLKDLINFKITFKKLPMIKEIRLDEETIQTAVSELGPQAIATMFKLGAKLQLVLVLMKNGSYHKYTREAIMNKTDIAEDAENIGNQAFMENKMHMFCRANNGSKWDSSTVGDNVWGMKLAKSSLGRASESFLDKNRPKLGSTLLYGTVGIVGGALGASLWAVSRGVKGLFGLGRSFR